MPSRLLLCAGLAVAISLATLGSLRAQEQNDTRGLGAAVSTAHSISGTRRALVVGISEYLNLPESQQLRYADDDAEMIDAFLRSPAGGPTQYATLLLNERATSGAIMDALLSLRDQAQPGDEIIFYFAGHGDVEDIGGDVNRGRLLAYDAPANQVYPGWSGTIAVQTVQDIMEVIVDKGARVIILTDACRSGSMNSGLEGAQVTAAKLAGTWSNVFRFVSSSANQLSEEDSALRGGHGVFTYYLLNGLLGAADGMIAEDGVVEATEINLYVTQQVRRHTENQTPVLTGDPGRVLSTVSPAVTWETLEQLVQPRSETPQYVADRGLAPEEREARREELSSEQRAAIEQFEARLNSGQLIGDGGAMELYETLRNRVPNSYFSDLGQQLAIALEAQVQSFFSANLRVSIESDRELLTEAQTDDSAAGAGRGSGGDSIWDVPYEEITAAADAMDAALALRGATYFGYPTMRSQADFLRGWAAVVEGEYAEGIERLNALTTPSAFSLNALGYAYYYNQQPDEAAEALAQAVSLAPNWAEPRRFQGYVAQYQGNFDEALKYYEAAASVAPEDPFLRVDIGAIHARTNDLDAAMTAWRQALDINAEAAASDIADFIVFRLRAADRMELVESIYAEALMRKPDSPSLHVDRGDMYRYFDRPNDAEEDYKRALRIDPNYAFAHNGLGLLYEFQERYEEADEAYQRTSELMPDSPIPWRNLADVYRAQERYQDAITAYERALASDATYSDAHLGLGNVYADLENYEQAEYHLLRNTEIADDDGAWIALGIFYEINLDQYEDALRAYERARDLSPEDAWIHANLGDARRKLGRRYEAAGAYREALTYDPSEELAITGLERLEDYGIVPHRDRAVERYPGRLDASAEKLTDDSYFVPHTIYGTAGEEWTILLWSRAFDPYLLIWDGNGNVLAEDDDGGPGFDASITVTLPNDGQYTIVANTFSQGEYGDYEIVMLRERPEAEGYGEAQVFTGELTMRSEEMDDGRRLEVHNINANAGEQLEITAASDAFDTRLFVSTGDNIIADDDDGAAGTNSRIVLTVPTSGQYVLAVTSYEPDGMGEYRLAVRRVTGQAAAASTPNFGQPEVRYGSLSTNSMRLDSDQSPYEVHEISASIGETIEITMESSEFDTYLLLFDPYGNVVDEDDDSGSDTNSRITFTAASGGNYEIYANSFDSQSYGSYSLSIRRSSGASSGGSAMTASPSILGEPELSYGSLSPSSTRLESDQSPYDIHRISASMGEVIEVTMQSSEFDTYLLVFDPYGNVVDEDDDSGTGTNSRITFTASTNGTYEIYANSYDAQSYGAYTLSVRRGSGGGSGGGSMAASMGGTLDDSDLIAGELTRANERIDDGPYFAVHTITASAGETLTFTLASQTFDTYIYVYTMSGELIGDDDDSGGGTSGTDSRVTVTAPSDGELVVFASGYDANDLGTYTLEVERGPHRDAL